MDQLEINKNLNEELESQNEDNNSLSLEDHIQEDAVPRGDVSINLSHQMRFGSSCNYRCWIFLYRKLYCLTPLSSNSQGLRSLVQGTFVNR